MSKAKNILENLIEEDLSKMIISSIKSGDLDKVSLTNTIQDDEDSDFTTGEIQKGLKKLIKSEKVRQAPNGGLQLT